VNDAGKAYQRACFQNESHPVGTLAEAMKNTADFSGEWLELRERVVKGVTLVDDAIQPGFGGNFELLLEKVSLLLFVTRVVFRAAAGFSARQPVIVQAGFTDGNDFGMPAHFAQGGAEVGRRLQDIGRMPADGGENARDRSANLIARALLSRSVPMK